MNVGVVVRVVVVRIFDVVVHCGCSFKVEFVNVLFALFDLCDCVLVEVIVFVALCDVRVMMW